MQLAPDLHFFTCVPDKQGTDRSGNMWETAHTRETAHTIDGKHRRGAAENQPSPDTSLRGRERMSDRKTRSQQNPSDLMTDQAEKLHDLVADFTDAMLVTRSLSGGLHARPMRIADLEHDADLWFVSSTNSGKIHEIEEKPEVNVTLQGGGKYISLSGRVSIDNDRSKIESMWREPLRTWFPEGKDDPRIVLLRFEASEGEYWDNSGAQGIKYLFKAGKAYLQGKTPDIDQSIHSKVNP